MNNRFILVKIEFKNKLIYLILTDSKLIEGLSENENENKAFLLEIWLAQLQTGLCKSIAQVAYH